MSRNTIPAGFKSDGLFGSKGATPPPVSAMSTNDQRETTHRNSKQIQLAFRIFSKFKWLF